MGKILPITIHPHPVLQQVAAPCAGADATTLALAEDMLATLAIADGVGLAAPQVGHSLRLVVLDMGEETPEGKRNYAIKKPEILINPEIIELSPEKFMMQEGCLSLPGLWAEVEHNTWIKVRYTNRSGEVVEETAKKLRAAIIQHEIDHLNGILFTDKLTAARKAVAMPKWQKLRQALVKHGGSFDVISAEHGRIAARRDEPADEE